LRDWVTDPALVAFVIAAACLCSAGVFGALWSSAHREHDELTRFFQLGAEADRWRYTRTVLARHREGPGEEWRRWQRRCLFGFAIAVIAFVALAVLEV
jgi:hypothetical protein